METVTALMTTGFFMAGMFNFYLASGQPEGHSIINWFAGIVTMAYGFILVAMYKHMSNEDKHLNKLTDSSKLVTHEMCTSKHDAVVNKIEEVQKRLIEKNEQTKKDYLKELRYTKVLIKLLLVKSGVDTSQLLDTQDDEV